MKKLLKNAIIKKDSYRKKHQLLNESDTLMRITIDTTFREGRQLYEKLKALQSKE